MKRSRGNKFADIFYGTCKALGIVALCLGIMALLGYGASRIVLKMGESSLRKEASGKTPNLGQELEPEIVTPPEGSLAEATAAPAPTAEPYVWKEGWVRYNGKIYEYKENILTFLMLGIDKTGKVSKNKTDTDGGQSDAVFLVVTDPDKKEISLIGVNRDTIVDVVMKGVKGPDGQDLVYPAQLAVQHGFGDGMNDSCEMSRDRVSELFFDLPIHGYASMNMGAIAQLNDALGGVKLTILEDMTKQNKNWKQGTEVTLKGKDAFLYVKWRDTTIFESNRGRLARQKQYLNAFLSKALAATKADLTTPVKLYNALKDYIVTDLTVDEIAYLASELSGYSFNGDIYTLEGRTEVRNEHEVFYPDQQALKDLLIKVFYREVSPG